jgi:hypothetical protein
MVEEWLNLSGRILKRQMQRLLIAALASIATLSALASPPRHWISMRVMDGACIDVGYGDLPGEIARSIQRELHQKPSMATLDDGTVLIGWWERSDAASGGKISRATGFFYDWEHCLMLQQQMIKNGDLPGDE